MRQTIFLGNKTAGKTQLINTLCQVENVNKYTPTLAIDLRIHTLNGETLICLDTPGGIDNPYILKNYLQKVNDICFVVDSTADLFDQLVNITRIIDKVCKETTFNKPPRYSIVTTKIDDPSTDKENNAANYKEYLEDLTGVKFKFFSVSTILEEGIDELRNYLCPPLKEHKATVTPTLPFLIRPIPAVPKAVERKKPVIDESSPEHKSFLELRKRVNEIFYKRYIGSIAYPSLSMFKLPFAVLGIGPHHMQRAKAILNIINTKAFTFEDITAILRHEEALLSGKATTKYAQDLIADPKLLTMKNIPKELLESGYYEIIDECLDEKTTVKSELRVAAQARRTI
jgi:signal recognition particle receptor subunit beta